MAIVKPVICGTNFTWVLFCWQFITGLIKTNYYTLWTPHKIIVAKQINNNNVDASILDFSSRRLAAHRLLSEVLSDTYSLHHDFPLDGLPKHACSFYSKPKHQNLPNASLTFRTPCFVSWSLRSKEQDRLKLNFIFYFHFSNSIITNLASVAQTQLLC